MLHTTCKQVLYRTLVQVDVAKAFSPPTVPSATRLPGTTLPRHQSWSLPSGMRVLAQEADAQQLARGGHCGKYSRVLCTLLNNSCKRPLAMSAHAVRALHTQPACLQRRTDSPGSNNANLPSPAFATLWQHPHDRPRCRLTAVQSPRTPSPGAHGRTAEAEARRARRGWRWRTRRAPARAWQSTPASPCRARCRAAPATRARWPLPGPHPTPDNHK